MIEIFWGLKNISFNKYWLILSWKRVVREVWTFFPLIILSLLISSFQFFRKTWREIDPSKVPLSEPFKFEWIRISEHWNLKAFLCIQFWMSWSCSSQKMAPCLEESGHFIFISFGLIVTSFLGGNKVCKKPNFRFKQNPAYSKPNFKNLFMPIRMIAKWGKNQNKNY